MVKLLLTAVVLIVLLPGRTADPDAASLGGRVTDENNVPIPGARISVRDSFSEEFHIVKTDSEGIYKVEALRQGRYSVFAQAESYGCKWVFNVLVFRGQHTNLDLVLTDARRKRRTVPGESTRSEY